MSGMSWAGVRLKVALQLGAHLHKEQVVLTSSEYRGGFLLITELGNIPNQMNVFFFLGGEGGVPWEGKLRAWLTCGRAVSAGPGTYRPEIPPRKTPGDINWKRTDTQDLEDGHSGSCMELLVAVSPVQHTELLQSLLPTPGYREQDKQEELPLFP